jgi:hypothetical protein
VTAALVRAAAAFVGAPAPTGARRDALAARVRTLIAAQPEDRRRLLRFGAVVLDGLAVLRYGRRFRALDDARAEAWLRSLSRAPFAPLRRLHAGLKLLLQYAWYLDPEAAAETGYDGPWLGRFPIEAGPPPDLGGAARPAETGS